MIMSPFLYPELLLNIYKLLFLIRLLRRLSYFFDRSYLPLRGQDGLENPLRASFVPCAGSGTGSLACVISHVVIKKRVHPQASTGKPIVTRPWAGQGGCKSKK